MNPNAGFRLCEVVTRDRTKCLPWSACRARPRPSVRPSCDWLHSLMLQQRIIRLDQTPDCTLPPTQSHDSPFYLRDLGEQIEPEGRATARAARARTHGPDHEYRMDFRFQALNSSPNFS